MEIFVFFSQVVILIIYNRILFFFLETNASLLKKVFGDENSRETHITVALSEHLLKPLSPGQFSILDSTMNGKDKCQCGCMTEDLNKYGNTFIGKTQMCGVV